jgi:hypothetical protein
MFSSESMVFFDTCLAYLLLAAILRAALHMKTTQSSVLLRFVTRMMGLAVCFFPTLLLAHPGHYHPDETDEFDMIRSMFLHSHGIFDWVLIGVALASLVAGVLAVRPVHRMSALAIGVATISLLATL